MPALLSRSISAIAAVSLMTVSPVKAINDKARHFQYIADAVNDINRLKSMSSSANGHGREITDLACKMLSQAVEDQEFKSAVSKAWGKLNSEQRDALLGLGKIDDVVRAEQHALDDIGVDQRTSVQTAAIAITYAKNIDPEK